MKKNIIIISCVAPPESNTAAWVNWDIANRCASDGYNVVLISPVPSRPMGRFFEEKAFDRIIKRSLRHIRVSSYIHPRSGVFGRSIESLSFGLAALWQIKKLGLLNPIVYCMSWPVWGQLVLVYSLKKMDVVVISVVQDLYPESYVNRIKNKFIKKIVQPIALIDSYIANKSDHLVTVSSNLRDFYVEKRGAKAGNITVLENWQDESVFSTKLILADLWKRYGLSCVRNKRVFLYLGNIGPVAGLEEVIMAFSRLGSDHSALIIAGSGSKKEASVQLVSDLKVNNIKFVDIGVGLHSVAELQALASVCLLPVIDGGAEYSVPSKMISYMFSKKPIITSATPNSFTGRIILEAKCGWVTSPLNGWLESIREVEQLSAKKLESKGQAGFSYAINNFSKKVGVDRAMNLIKSMTSS